MTDKSRAIVQVTLDMLILKTLALEPLHGRRLKAETRGWETQSAAIARILNATPREI
jgi:hypothetical protein